MYTFHFFRPSQKRWEKRREIALPAEAINHHHYRLHHSLSPPSCLPENYQSTKDCYLDK